MRGLGLEPGLCDTESSVGEDAGRQGMGSCRHTELEVTAVGANIVHRHLKMQSWTSGKRSDVTFGLNKLVHGQYFAQRLCAGSPVSLFALTAFICIEVKAKDMGFYKWILIKSAIDQ